MPYKPRRSLAPSEEQEAIRLHLQGVPLRQIAEQLESSYGTIQRLTRRHRLSTSNGQPELPKETSPDTLTDDTNEPSPHVIVDGFTAHYRPIEDIPPKGDLYTSDHRAHNHGAQGSQPDGEPGSPHAPEEVSTGDVIVSNRRNVEVDHQTPEMITEPVIAEAPSDEATQPELAHGIPDGEPGGPHAQISLVTLSDQTVHPSTPDGEPTIPTTLPERVEVVGEPWVHHTSPPLLQDLAARLDVVEAFIATLQRNPSQLSASSHGSPQSLPGAPLKTRKRGFVIAEVLSDKIDAYAAAEHLQVKDVLDLALREFFARRGWSIAEGE
jgi:hypothetical protein